jgi:nucleotide-binding universal stress UspA family protein
MRDNDNTANTTDTDTPDGVAFHEHILVGVDASESSLAALAWAAGQARLTGLPLRVVHAWTFVPYPYVDPLLVRSTAEEAAQQVLRRAIDDAIGDDDTIDVRAEIVVGHPARVLGRLGRTARMIVIGGGGHGELAGLLLGSVGLHLAAHAPVPVVIVPAIRVPATVAAATGGDSVAAPVHHPFTFL